MPLTDLWRDHDRQRLSAIMAAEHAGNRAVTAYYNENDPKAAAIIEAFDAVTAAQPAE